MVVVISGLKIKISIKVIYLGGRTSQRQLVRTKKWPKRVVVAKLVIVSGTNRKPIARQSCVCSFCGQGRVGDLLAASRSCGGAIGVNSENRGKPLENNMVKLELMS